jgi:hypothetical protein
MMKTPKLNSTKRFARVWVEEFEPGHMAINVVEAVPVDAQGVVLKP